MSSGATARHARLASIAPSIGRCSNGVNADARSLAADSAGPDRPPRRRVLGAVARRRSRQLAWRLLLPGRRHAPLHRRPHPRRVPAAVRPRALRRMVLEGAPAVLELGLRRLIGMTV